MNKQAKSLCGTDIGANLVFEALEYDHSLRQWLPQQRVSPITMITHKKNLGVNVRVGPSEGYKHQGETQFQPNDWVVVVRD